MTSIALTKVNFDLSEGATINSRVYTKFGFVQAKESCNGLAVETLCGSSLNVAWSCKVNKQRMSKLRTTKVA